MNLYAHRPSAAVTVAPSASAMQALSSELIGQLGSEVAGPLSSALERLTGMAASGRIDPLGLRALREEVEQARRLGQVGQQLSRLAANPGQADLQRVDLAQAVGEAVAQRGREAAARGLSVRHKLSAALVMVDPAVLTVLLQAVLDWSLQHACSSIEWQLDMKQWPTHARLGCRFAYAPCAAQAEAGATHLPFTATQLDTLSWRLVQHAAQALGLAWQRHDSPSQSWLVLEFSRTVSQPIDGVIAVELGQRASPSTRLGSLGGQHVLVVAANKDTRLQVREAISDLGLMVDYVTSVRQAQELCVGGLPNVILYESALVGPDFVRLRQQILAELPRFAFIEISEEALGFEVSNFDAQHGPRINPDAIRKSLSSALVFEISKRL